MSILLLVECFFKFYVIIDLGKGEILKKKLIILFAILLINAISTTFVYAQENSALHKTQSGIFIENSIYKNYVKYILKIILKQLAKRIRNNYF